MFSPAQGAQEGGIIGLAPGLNQPPVEVLAHDDTAQPGKTYRYLMQYRLLNSVYQTNVKVTDKRWHDQFALVSPLSAPTGPLTIPDISELFVRGISNSKTEVHFDVFVWKQLETVKDVSASPGDAVVGTNWTVVDIRNDLVSHELFVLLINTEGELQRRDSKTDQNLQRYKDLQDEVKNPQAARAN